MSNNLDNVMDGESLADVKGNELIEIYQMAAKRLEERIEQLLALIIDNKNCDSCSLTNHSLYMMKTTMQNYHRTCMFMASHLDKDKIFPMPPCEISTILNMGREEIPLPSKAHGSSVKFCQESKTIKNEPC